MRKNLLSEDYLSCREVSPAAAAAVVLQKRLGFSIWYVVSIHFSWREDMKHETRMARLGVRSTSSTHHIHLDDYTHTSYNVNFGESFLTISNLYTTFLVQHKVLLLYSSRYSAHHMMRQSSAKFTKKCSKVRPVNIYFVQRTTNSYKTWWLPIFC